MRNKFLAAVFAATMAVSGLVGVAPASATEPVIAPIDRPGLISTSGGIGIDFLANWPSSPVNWTKEYDRLWVCKAPPSPGEQHTPDPQVPSLSGCVIAVDDFSTDPNAGDFSFSSNLNTSSTAYDPATHGRWFVYVSEATGTVNSSSATRYVWTSVEANPGGAFGAGSPPPPPPLPVVTPPPYTGPMITPPAGVIAASAGGKVMIPGSRLGGVSKVEIAGLDAEITVSSDGELSIVVPRGLAAGVYDLVITSSSGRLTVQGALRVSGSAASSGAASEVRPSTRLIAENSLKVWAFGAVGAGKVQIMLNGQEVAWVNAASADDPKLRDGYLVRTLTLAAGKNVIEVYVDGERVSRRVATGS